MALTKVSYAMVNGAPFNVLDYASLATTVSAKDPSDAASHLFTSFLSWRAPIQAALNAAGAAGGGTVVIPKNSVPYYLDDYIYISSNTTVICQDLLILADYTSIGAAISVSANNVYVQNLLLDNSNIYAGGSGQNGVGISSGKNIKFYGGKIINCKSGNNNNGTGDGGKGVQIENGNGDEIVIDGMTFFNCFMAMSSIRDFTNLNPYHGIIFNNITANNCNILLFVRQANGAQSETGLQHSVKLNNFYALNCGFFEGTMQFSRASNVQVSNGIIACDSSPTPSSLIRGNHANCSFVNISWYANTDSCINLDPSTYAIDSSQVNKDNVYEINVLGQLNYFVNASIATSYRTLDGCTGRFITKLSPATAFFGYELRNGFSVFELIYNTKLVKASTNVAFDTSNYPYNFAGYSNNYNAPAVNTITQTYLPSVAANAANNTVYVNSSDGKLYFKDGSGVAHALY